MYMMEKNTLILKQILLPYILEGREVLTVT